MYCNNCGSKVPDGAIVCQSCGASMNQMNAKAQDALINRFRQETERTMKENEVSQLAEKSRLAGIITICLIAMGVGIIAMGLAFYFGIRSNRLADELQIPRDKKAQTGILLACVPFMVGALAGIICGLLAACGVL